MLAVDFIFDWVSNYGYVAIFALLVSGIVGLPIPDETLLVFSGYLIWRGNLKLAPTVATAFLGSACGITLSYVIGRTLGIGFVHKWGRYIHVTEARLARVHRWFDRVGHWALFIGYYIAGVRHFTAVIAGTSLLEYRSFAAYAYSGGFIWVCTFISIGYFFGDRWHQVIDSVHHNLVLASALVIGAAIVYLLIRWFLNRARPRP